MRLILPELRSRLQYKIIVPFLLLTLFVALAGSAIAFSLVAGSWQERFDNQLAQVARATSDSLVDQERANLQFLQEATFAQRNERTGAPAVAEALGSGDAPGLTAALDPYFRVGVQRATVRLDRLIAFDRHGKTAFDWERPAGAPASEHTVNPALDLGQTWFVPQVLAAGQDTLGDKFAGLILLPDTNDYYIATIAPVRQGDQVVGGMIIAMRVETLLEVLQQRSQAAIVGIYDGSGNALASTTIPAEGINTLALAPEALKQLSSDSQGEDAVIFTVPVNARAYQFAYSPLRVRSATIGILSVALSRDYVLGAWADARLPLAALTVSLMLAIVGLGIFIARLITAPLQELVGTAQAVMAGNLSRRSRVQSADEVGLLASSFNSMTEHLLQLYGTVRAESSERAAIVESIGDGVVVCSINGSIQSANRAMRSFLKLADGVSLPPRFSDLPLVPVPEGTLFGERRVTNLFMLNDHIVRVSASPVLADDGVRLGSVCVIQDMTSEAAVDRAKTNFISIISHELRTPLTVLRGNADLILRGLMGPIEPDQRSLIETMRNHAINMTSLVNNVIVIAGLDSGSLVSDPEPLDLRQVIEEAIWPLRAQISARNLELKYDLPQELPAVWADMSQVRNIITQLVDNSRRYTATGSISITVNCLKDKVRLDVSDTGKGIPLSMRDQLFTRFVRGDGSGEGINSSERGIGLGLAIVKQLVERQGGEIWVASTSENGTTFSFTLPYTNATQQVDQPPGTESRSAA